MNMPVVAGVELDDGTQILADLVVLTMGAWTEQAREWLGTFALYTITLLK